MTECSDWQAVINAIGAFAWLVTIIVTTGGLIGFNLWRRRYEQESKDGAV